MNISRDDFGATPNGQPVFRFTLTNGAGAIARLTNYGARLTQLQVPDRRGQRGDVVLGFDNLPQYLGPNPYFGTTVGRVANRIAGGSFTLDGVAYSLPINNGPNTLHGGIKGIDRDVWSARESSAADGASVEFSLLSPDGDQGFPGNLTITVRYTLTEKTEIRIEYAATTDKPTPVNLSNHSYFNLAGAGSGRIYDHVLTLNASHYTPVDATLIPTGRILPVRGTPMDFTTPAPIGSRIDQVPGGYDHNYVLDPTGGQIPLIALVEDPKSGRAMKVYTTEPGVQFYTGNFLDGSMVGIGGRYEENGAFCLEAQHFPDAVHHPNFPNTILRPGETYRQTTIYAFAVA